MRSAEDLPWLVTSSGIDGLPARGADGRRSRRGAAPAAQAGSGHAQSRSCAAPPPSARRASPRARSATAARCSVSSDSSAHFRRAGLISMPRRSSTSLGVIGLRRVDGLALDLVGQERRAGLADRAAAPGEADLGDHARRGPELHRDPVAAQGVRALVGDASALSSTPEVMRAAGSARGCSRGTDRPSVLAHSTAEFLRPRRRSA